MFFLFCFTSMCSCLYVSIPTSTVYTITHILSCFICALTTHSVPFSSVYYSPSVSVYIPQNVCILSAQCFCSYVTDVDACYQCLSSIWFSSYFTSVHYCLCKYLGSSLANLCVSWLGCRSLKESCVVSFYQLLVSYISVPSSLVCVFMYFWDWLFTSVYYLMFRFSISSLCADVSVLYYHFSLSCTSVPLSLLCVLVYFCDLLFTDVYYVMFQFCILPLCTDVSVLYFTCVHYLMFLFCVSTVCFSCAYH